MVTIQGLEQFEKKLKTLDLSVQRKGLTKAVKAGAELIRQQSSDNVRSQGLVLTGRLEDRQIVSIAAADSNAYYVLARIGPARDAFYGGFGEWGTIFQAETPFLQPAVEEELEAAVIEAGKVLKEIVESA